MKIIFKKAFAIFIGTASLLVLPDYAQALEGVSVPAIRNTTELRSDSLASKRAELCEKFTSTRLGEKSNKVHTKIEQKLDERSSSIGEKRSEWDTKRTEVRTLADGKRLEHYEKLLENAATEERKLAVGEFKLSIENAVTERRLAQDKAKDTYRNAVDVALASQSSGINSASSEIKIAIESALAKARTSCENGASVQEASNVLKADLDKARDDFKVLRGGSEGLKELINQLKDERKASAGIALDKFRTDVLSAKDTLRATFSEQP